MKFSRSAKAIVTPDSSSESLLSKPKAFVWKWSTSMAMSAKPMPPKGEAVPVKQVSMTVLFSPIAWKICARGNSKPSRFPSST